MDGTLGIILNRWKPHVKFISLWLVVWDTRTTIKQLERSEILSEGTFVIFSVIVSLLSDKGAFSNYLYKTRYDI